MSKRKVLFTEAVNPVAEELMATRPEFELVTAPDTSHETLKTLVADVDAIGARMALLPADILSAAPKLQVVSRHGVGCDNIDVAHLTSRGIPMAIAAGANAVSVAEHTIMLMLVCIRRLHAQELAVKEGRYAERISLSGHDVLGKHALVIGFGRTGFQVAQRLKAFGMRVSVCDIRPLQAEAEALGCEFTHDFHDALATADVITVHTPLDDSTQYLLSEAEFAQMKEGVIVLNCARGGIIKETALIDSLDNGATESACIDVFEIEPPLMSDPLLARDDVISTPHTAGTSSAARINMATMMVQNFFDAFDGKLLPENTLDPSVFDLGYPLTLK